MDSKSIAVVCTPSCALESCSTDILGALSDAGFEKAICVPADNTLPASLSVFGATITISLPCDKTGLQTQSLLSVLGHSLVGLAPKHLVACASKRSFLRSLSSRDIPTEDPSTSSCNDKTPVFYVPLLGNPGIKTTFQSSAVSFAADGFCAIPPVPMNDAAKSLQTPKLDSALCDLAKRVFVRGEMCDFAAVEIEAADPANGQDLRVLSVSGYPCVDVSPFVTVPGESVPLAEPKVKKLRRSPSKQSDGNNKMSMGLFISLLAAVASARINKVDEAAGKKQGKKKGAVDAASALSVSDLDKEISQNLAVLQEMDKDDVVEILRSDTKMTSTEGLRKENVAPEDWNSWRWQLSHRVKTLAQLRSVLKLSPEEEAAFQNGESRFPMAITPYVISLIDPNDFHDPIRQEFIPRAAESQREVEDIEDSLGEDTHMPVPGVVHRYPDRVLMLVSMSCATYCRFCTRNRVVGQKQAKYTALEPHAAYFERQLEYIRSNPAIRDVLLSGGDPLLIPMRTLDWILTELRRIPHIEVLRIGSRVPITLPQRITPALCRMLHQHHPLWMNIHVNHPNELSPDAARGLALLADAGIPLGCQTVLLAGINDCPNIQMKLVHKLVENRVRPYYIYQCDLVVGAAHFRTPVSKITEVIEALRGHTSGFCVPTAVIDAPHGGGKVPVFPNYLISLNETKAVVRNFEGFISTYTGPKVYKSHDPEHCSFCREANKKVDRQEGVIGLLAGKQSMIKPEGWDKSHIRRCDDKEE